MRIAYHLQTHKDPRQILRLVDRIRRGSDGETIVLVSHQTGGEPLAQRDLEAGGEAVLLPSSGGYGDFSHVDRYLESVDWLLDRDDPFDWFVNISGQDYPLRPARVWEAELAAGQADAWIGFFDVFGPESKWPRARGVTRYDFRHWRTTRMTQRWQRRLRPLGAVNLVQPVVRVSPSFGAVGVRRRSMFTEDFRCYGGSFWGAVSREAAAYVADYTHSSPQLAAYLRGSLAPDEVYVQTVLGNAGRFTIRPEARRYFDFSLGMGNHPKVLTTQDLPRMTASTAWFARKFDPAVDSAVLDALDRANGWDESGG
ncbi:N-acetylglucosaminyltransferase [Phycicoccus endophyticus]|uniref:Peptide O-xylosyltransferase n=1 Tax=Phycicoccus endophyticus TaxID=1690220 RepID=A0A7G9R2F5_9MICO|nr:beta-1,6-N-acetylglucosaminyltransferase [Phycicoccus endophyticus]NHI20836.1 N-acetylglucosaminyltransferase [Phycicoccus endophyticus]QNN49780.1 N-acetylglucosaminyltransferase [Phycicoccus endophyticus]GGL35099.1 glycosyl transferase [Phycicoccus endophyticus]